MTTTQQQTATATDNAKATVLSFIAALDSEDFSGARQYVNDDLTFIGVMGTRHGADIYLSEMARMKFKYDIKKAFADGSDVCLYYDINMGSTTIFASGWYQLVDGKISEFKVIFDPRPLLEQKG